jgi:hypothetical protein
MEAVVRPRAVCVVAALLSCALFVARPSASVQQVVRVKVGPARVLERPQSGAEVMLTVPEGTRLEVIQKEGDWYWVFLPREPSGTQKAGYIQSFLVEVVGGKPLTVEPEKLAPPTVPGAQAARIPPRGRPSGAIGPRYLLHLDGGYQPTSVKFDDTVVSKLYLEDETIVTRNRAKGGAVLGVGGGVRLWKNFILGLDVSRFRKVGSAEISATLPHPLNFGEPRSLEADGAIRHQAIGLHVELAWLFPLSRRMDLTISGGPSLFRVRQDLVSNVRFAEAYPFDTVRFEGPNLTRRFANAPGFNVGGDLAFAVWRQFGVGARVRYSRGRGRLISPDNDRLWIDVGGVQAVGGLRVRF